MKIGTLVYWNPDRKFGFIEHKTPVNGGGFYLTKYYLHASRIDFIAVEEIEKGLTALFDVSPVKSSRRPTDAEYAINVHLFETEAQARLFNEAKPKEANLGLEKGLETLAAPSQEGV